MNTYNRQPTKVVWTEGMLMSPQHLQQADRYHEQMLFARFSAVSPYSWGIRNFELDMTAIERGDINLRNFEGIFPDGLPLNLSVGAEELPKLRNVTEHFGAHQTKLDVYLGVPIEREGIVNYDCQYGDLEGKPQLSKHMRYRTGTRDVCDFTQEKNTLAVQLGVPNSSILFENENRDDFVCIKIAEVARVGNGSYKYIHDYIPPALALRSSSYLQEDLTDLHSQVVAKHRELGGQRRQRDEASAEFSGKDINLYLILSAIATNLPFLGHMANDKDLSPFASYLGLSQFAGQLTAFAPKVDPSTLPHYEHLDLRETFTTLIAKIREMLGAQVKDRYITIPLDARKDGMWIGRLRNELIPKCHTFILGVETDRPEQDVANQLPGLSKIASWKAIHSIVKAATPGAPLRAQHRPPDEIPIRPKHVYFKVVTSDRYWQEITGERTIAIYLPPPYDVKHAKITLMGIPPLSEMKDKNSD